MDIARYTWSSDMARTEAAGQGQRQREGQALAPSCSHRGYVITSEIYHDMFQPSARATHHRQINETYMERVADQMMYNMTLKNLLAPTDKK